MSSHALVAFGMPIVGLLFMVGMAYAISRYNRRPKRQHGSKLVKKSSTFLYLWQDVSA